MTAGTNTYNGMAVPLNGNASIVPASDALDGLTLACSASMSANGVVVTGTFIATSGYQSAFYANVTAGGDKGSGVASTQFNAVAVDLVMDGTSSAAGYGGMYIYISKSGSFTDTSAVVYGACLDLQETGQVDYRCNLWLQNSASVAGCGIDTYILFSGQGEEGGKNASMFYYQGITKPAYFLHLQDASVSGMYSDSAIGEATNSDGALLVKIGSNTFQIPLYAAT